MTDDGAPDDALAALRAGYARKLPDKLDEVNEAAAGLDDADPLAAVQAVRHLVHKLAGSAPSFGFPEIGDAARIVERACDAVLEAGAAGADAIAEIRAKVSAMAACDGADTPEGGATPAPTAGDESASSLAGRVLVVEDERSQALFVQVILKKAGLEVFLEGDPTMVPGRLAEVAPDLVFLDMNMPKMNGDELAALIRARDDSLATVPIVFLSGEEDPARRDAALAAGGNGFVAKPVKPAELVDAARRFLAANPISE